MDVTSFVLGLKKGAEGNLKTQEKAVTVVENGVTEILPDTGYALSKVLMNVNVPTGGGCAQFTEYLAETTFTNEYIPDLGAFASYVPLEDSVMEAWMANRKQVIVVYDGEEYTCTPQVLTEADGSVGVGNLATFGGTANGEPFAVAIIGLDVGYYFLIGSTVDTAPAQHTVRIYQEVSGGDGEWIIAEGHVTSSSGDPVVIEHGLGVIPDIVFITAGVSGPMSNSTNSKTSMIAGFHFSERLMSGAEDKVEYGFVFLFIPKSTGGMVGRPSVGLENASSGTFGCVCEVTNNTMKLGTDYTYLLPNVAYSWYAYAKK